MIDELLPFVRETYDPGLLRPAQVLDFFPTAQMRLAFAKRREEGGEYLRLAQANEEHDWDAFFRYELGYGVIESCYLVDIRSLLEQNSRDLIARGGLRKECFEAAELVVGDSRVRYRDLEARWVIFCDGVCGRAGRLFLPPPICAE